MHLKKKGKRIPPPGDEFDESKNKTQKATFFVAKIA